MPGLFDTITADPRLPGLLGGTGPQLTPDQRRKLAARALTAQFDRATPQDTEVVERASMFPLGTYANGMTGLALPGFITQPFASFKRLMDEGYTSGSEQGAEDAFNVAGAAMVGGLAAPKPSNTVGIFGGRLAKTADHAKLAQAEKMAAEGTPREQIWNQTGWFQGPDKKWRFEIDDSKANLYDPIGSGDLRYKFEHRDLRQAYPDIQDARLSREVSGEGGFYSAPYASKREAFGVNKGEEYPKSTLLHEIQHGLQRREGFAVGTSPSRMGWSESLDFRKTLPPELSHRFSNLPVDEQRSMLYGAHVGEAEARLVEKRMDMTAENRRARPPWLDYDVPEANQIVRFGDGGVQNSRPRGSIGMSGRPATGAAVNAAESSQNASRNANIFAAPSKPQRPFEADYDPVQNPARADASGRLTHTIDGDPITAPYVAGRRMVGAADEPLPASAFDPVSAATTGGVAQAATAREMGRDVGRLAYDRRSGRPTDIWILNSLKPGTRDKVYAHELGHVIERSTAGSEGMPTGGILRRELQPVYNSLNNPNRGRPGTPEAGDAATWAKPVRPEHFGYRGGNIPHEYMAEAIRAYMTDPNYLKTVAPETARRIRTYVNTHPELSKTIQFNANGGRPGAAVGATANAQDQDPSNIKPILDKYGLGHLLNPTDWARKLQPGDA